MDKSNNNRGKSQNFQRFPRAIPTPVWKSAVNVPKYGTKPAKSGEIAGLVPMFGTWSAVKPGKAGVLSSGFVTPRPEGWFVTRWQSTFNGGKSSF